MARPCGYNLCCPPKAGSLDVKKGFLSTIAAFFSISGGASVGIYGPLVHFGGTLAAFLRRITFIPNIPHNVIIGAGVAAAISAGFGSPIAGIIFAHEVILRYFSIRALTAISLASVSASFLAQSLNIVEPDLRFVVFSFELVNSIPGLNHCWFNFCTCCLYFYEFTFIIN